LFLRLRWTNNLDCHLSPPFWKGPKMQNHSTVLFRLMQVIEDRRANRPENSYTTQLLAGGVEAVAAKLREETAELIEAAGMPSSSKEAVIHEAADLLYHLLVMLACCDVQWAEVESELARRFGTSGLEEKAQRENR
jgi:phosphoribosyl-ATP pyrophosphohydrolase